MKNKRFVLLLTTLVISVTFACQRPAPDNAHDQLADERKALRGGAAKFECTDIIAVIPVDNAGQPMAVEGEKCSDNKTVINGWSRVCLGEKQCNTPTRLAEVNHAAETFCAEWCSKKKCDYVYTKRTKCDSSRCIASADCQQNCDGPFWDQCYLQKSAPDYNCNCRDRVNG